MGLWQGEDRVLDLFAVRFEADGSDYLFRSNFKAAPVRVTAAERDEAIASFKRGMRWTMLATIVATMAGIGILVAIDPQEGGAGADSIVGQMELWTFLLLTLGGFAVVYRQLWSAPTRQFSRRAPAGRDLTPEEARAAAFAKIKWSNLAIAPLGAIVILVPGRHEQLWDLSWTIKLVLVVLMLTFVGIQAFRKWRFDRSGS